MWQGIPSLPVLGDDSGPHGDTLEWAGGSSAPPLTLNLTFLRGTAPGKEEARAFQGTGPSTPRTSGRVLLNILCPALCLERQFPANSPILNPFHSH